MSFKIIQETITTKNNITNIKLNIELDDRKYTVHAAENPVTKSWEQWGAPSDVLKKTVNRIQEIFREKALGKAKGVFNGLY